jgi:hypothetical protein
MGSRQGFSRWKEQASPNVFITSALSGCNIDALIIFFCSSIADAP